MSEFMRRRFQERTDQLKAECFNLAADKADMVAEINRLTAENGALKTKIDRLTVKVEKMFAAIHANCSDCFGDCHNTPESPGAGCALADFKGRGERGVAMEVKE